MARIDVTDALLDPDFIDRLICERFMQTVGDDGIAVNTPTEIPMFGCVTTNSGDKLDRTPTGERVQGAITVHTRFRLIPGDDEHTADVLRWKGRRYTVTGVDDNSHFGRGFCAATCDLLPLRGGTYDPNDLS
jgi:hypothetical protein